MTPWEGDTYLFGWSNLDKQTGELASLPLLPHCLLSSLSGLYKPESLTSFHVLKVVFSILVNVCSYLYLLFPLDC